MDKLRSLSLAFLCGLISTPALAQLTTIGPNTPGVSEFKVTVVQNGMCDGLPCFFPQFTPIHPLLAVGQGEDLYSMAANGAGCFGGCPMPTQVFNPADVPANFSMFDVSFHTAEPVTTVVEQQMELSIGPTLGSTVNPELLAFDGQRVVATCIVMNAGAGCFSDVSVTLTLNGVPIAFDGNLTVSAPDITSVWIGSAPFGGPNPKNIQFGFGVPEPGTFALFALALAGLVIRKKRVLDLTLRPRRRPWGGHMKSAHLLSAAVMIAACGAAGAQTLVGPADGISGIDGLAVDGKTYDVTFNSGTLADAFPAGINFNNINSANDAATNLATALESFSVTGIGSPCGGGEFLTNCLSVFIPFSVDASGNTNSIVTSGFVCCSPHTIIIAWSSAEGVPVRSDASGPTTGPAFGFSYWGVLTPTTSVPEPASFGLLILGLAAVGFARRRKTTEA